MGFRWSRGSRRADHKSRKKGGAEGRSSPEEIVVPSHFICPISLELMKDPVTLSSGITYDRDSIERWLEEGNFTCPITNQVLRSFNQIPNHSIRRMIQDWCVENNQSRIPTPKVPIDPREVMEVLDEIKGASRRGDCMACLELVRRIEDWGSKWERNRQCIIVNGAAATVASAFSEFAANSSYNESTDTELMETLMSALNWMFPLDSEARQHLSSPAALRCMVRFLRNRDFSVKRNTILALKDVCSGRSQSLSLAEIEGIHEILVEFVKHPTHPTITKSSLSIMFNLISSSNEQSKRFIRLGAVAAVLEALVDPEKSLCEKALGVLDGLTGCEEGVAEANSNALTVPLLVKKILRVPELGTNYSVSILLRLCRQDDGGARVVTEALQVGAFQKVLVLLQVGCSQETREKGAELLKRMNPYRDELECIESADFKNLKRSF